MKANHIIDWLHHLNLTVKTMSIALVLCGVTQCQAQAGDDSGKEETLRADAEETFKKKVEPFVNKYCISNMLSKGNNIYLHNGKVKTENSTVSTSSSSNNNPSRVMYTSNYHHNNSSRFSAPRALEWIQEGDRP